MKRSPSTDGRNQNVRNQDGASRGTISKPGTVIRRVTPSDDGDKIRNLKLRHVRYLFIFLLPVFFIFGPAVSAREADPSRFPKYEPLMPPPENVAPDYEASFGSSAQAPLPGSPGTEPEATGTPENAGEGTPPEAAAAAPVVQSSFTNPWLLAAAFAVLALLVGITHFRGKKPS